MEKSYSKLHLFFGIYVVLWLNSGNFDYVNQYIPTVVKFALVFIWFAISIKKKHGYIINYLKIASPILVLIALMYVSNALGYTAYYKQYFMVYMYLAVLLGLFSYYFFYGKRKEVSTLISVFMVDTTAVAVHTYIELLNNPILSRAISTSAESQSELLGETILVGLGGYGLCYQLAFLTIIIALYLINKKPRLAWSRYILYYCVLMFLFKAQITLALILFIILLMTKTMVKKSKTMIAVILKMVFLVVFIGIIVNYKTVINFIIPYANDSLADRLKEIISASSYIESGKGDIYSRIVLYKCSWNAFLNNLSFGTFGNYPYGSHSTFLDLLAVYGVFGLYSIWGIIKPLVLTIQHYKNIEARRYVYIILVFFIVFSIINVSLGSEILLAVLVIIPLLSRIIYDDFEEACDESHSN